MRTHGWGGDPPHDDADARRRILAVTRSCLVEGGRAGLSEVAGRLGVTRQTVYRYFATTEELLDAAALAAVVELQGELVEHVRNHLAATGGDAGDAAVEAVVHAYEHLRDDPALNRLLAPGRVGATVSGLTEPASIALGEDLLTGFPVDWEALGLDAAGRAELVEHLLRTLQSLLLDPGLPPRTPEQVRGYLQRWLAPVLRARSSLTKP
ncbi:TetR/AcrR family transcriptional regulator [Nocardioides sp. SYSU D00038]|uniref:TetR/AcrR family transcriptional regulator n=1 Tax=Nocardioides sp. SYSU D00038 TaxID=2812554 RepID=UPI001966FCE2|nr:TetR/AcrR family transcriptional regulator [Nocardioides sp. SYSU D00038]